MENNSANIYDKYDIFHPKKISINNDFSLDLNQQNYYNIGITNDINSNDNPSFFTNGLLLNEFNFVKREDIILMSRSFSKDTLIETKSVIKDNISIINDEKNIEDKEDKEDKAYKEKILDKNNYPLNYLIRRAKKIIFDTLLKYDNDVISKVYNNNIGYGINTKKILRIKHFQIQNTNTNFNKKLLNTTQGIIFSSEISTRYTNYPRNHNKILINKLLNEENVEKRKIFNDLFSKTFLECIENLVGKRKTESLKGLDKYYEKEMMELDEEENFKELLKKIINDLNNIFEKKKPRKTKIKKEE